MSRFPTSSLCVGLALTILCLKSPGSASELQPSRHKGLCSAYSNFSPCEIFVYQGLRITANLPRDYLDVNRNTIIQIDICDADVNCKLLGGHSLGYVWDKSRISPFSAVVDFRIKYVSESTRRKTAIIRFYNRAAAEEFGASIIAATSALETGPRKSSVGLP